MMLLLLLLGFSWQCPFFKIFLFLMIFISLRSPIWMLSKMFPSWELSDIFFSRLHWHYVFGEGRLQRQITIFLTSHQDHMLSRWRITVDISSGHLAEIVLVGFLYYEVILCTLLSKLQPSDGSHCAQTTLREWGVLCKKSGILTHGEMCLFSHPGVCIHWLIGIIVHSSMLTSYSEF